MKTKLVGWVIHLEIFSLIPIQLFYFSTLCSFQSRIKLCKDFLVENVSKIRLYMSLMEKPVYDFMRICKTCVGTLDK